MSTEKETKKESKWFGRSLTNYKSMHAETAEKRGVGAQFQASKTLTEAKKILFGYKKGHKR